MSEVSPTSHARQPLTFRQWLTWAAHLFKAVAYQYHRPFLRQVQPLIAPDGVIIDAGAHSGQFTKLFARLVPRGHVYAFEPSPYALSILRPVMALRRFSNVTIVEKGLSDGYGRETLHLPIKRRGSVGFGLAHMGTDVSGRALLSYAIELMPLDGFAAAQELTRLDFIKADVEGWELNLLKGARATLERFRPALLLEVHEMTLARADATPQQVWDFLRALGYVAFATDEHEDYRFTPVDAWCGNGDYLFVPAAHAALVPVG